MTYASSLEGVEGLCSLSRKLSNETHGHIGVLIELGIRGDLEPQQHRA